ncbi:MAG: uracil-DNA glycosylase [Planctomycetota bacterium]
MSKAAWTRLRRSVTQCQLCPRLVTHCQTIATEKRKAYRNETYWGKPVPNFGTPNASLLIVGLAPGAHGANRTGRMFTGDRSGDWLYAAMHQAGFANQPESTGRRDGLKLIDATITNVGRCAPPGNKPLSDELNRCRPFFLETIRLVDPLVIIALGGLAWNATLVAMVEMERYTKPKRRPKFAHGATVRFDSSQTLLGCYHPSQQNTFTGRLTKKMIDSVFDMAKQQIEEAKRDDKSP